MCVCVTQKKAKKNIFSFVIFVIFLEERTNHIQKYVSSCVCQTGIMIIMSTLMFQLSKNTAYSIGSNNIKRKNLLYFRTEQLLDELLFALLTCVVCVCIWYLFSHLDVYMTDCKFY